MMLAAIVIGMAYTAFSLMARMSAGFREKNLAHADVQVLREVLQRDAERAGVILIADGTIDFSSESTPLQYEWRQDYLIRKMELAQDTFKTPALVVQAYFEGRSQASGIVDRLVLNFINDNVQIKLNIRKDYDSKGLFTNRRNNGTD